MTKGLWTPKGKPGTIIALALPIIAGIGSQNLMNLVDTAMLGRLGHVAQGAVGLSSMLIWVMGGLVQGMGSAVQAMTARRVGEGNAERKREALINGLAILTLFGLPLTVLLWWSCEPLFRLLSHDAAVRIAGTDYTSIRILALVPMGWTYCFRGYFNGTKRARTYMLVLFMVHPLNMLFNYLLIFGHFGLPALGVRGAAIGTLLANLIGVALFIFLMVRERFERVRNKERLWDAKQGRWLYAKNIEDGTTAAVRERAPLFSWAIWRSLLKISVPSSGHSLLLAGGFLVFFRIAAFVGTETLALTTVLVNIALVCILIAMGFGLASITLVGEALGRDLHHEAKAWVRDTARMAFLIVGGLGVLMALFAPQVLSIFILDPALREQARLPMILLGLSQSYNSLAIVYMHALQGGGAARTVMNITFVTQWLFFLPACWIWARYANGGLLALWICYLVYRFFLFLGLRSALHQDHWLQHKF